VHRGASGRADSLDDRLSNSASQNIALIGFMAVGKSAVGRNVARKLHRRFVDLDAVIEKKQGRKVREIFDSEGEGYFRRLEKQTLREVLSENRQVIATGGGVILDSDNLQLLREKCLLIGLSASPDVLLSRVGKGAKRPLLKGTDLRARIEELLEQRQSGYAQAHATVDTGGLSIEQVVERVLAIINAANER
jgi:shikimate kinase